MSKIISDWCSPAISTLPKANKMQKNKLVEIIFASVGLLVIIILGLSFYLGFTFLSESIKAANETPGQGTQQVIRFNMDGLRSIGIGIK